MYQGIAAAYNAGLNFDPNGLNPVPDHFTRSMNWASRVTFAGSSGLAYSKYRSTGVSDDPYGVMRSRRLTGAVLAARLLVGQDPEDQRCIDMAEWMWRTPHYNAGGTGGDIVGFVSGNTTVHNTFVYFFFRFVNFFIF